jgi:hypothetical protein
LPLPVGGLNTEMRRAFQERGSPELAGREPLVLPCTARRVIAPDESGDSGSRPVSSDRGKAYHNFQARPLAEARRQPAVENGTLDKCQSMKADNLHLTGTEPFAAHYSQARQAFPTWPEWCSFLLQILLVVGIELCDDVYHGFISPRSVAFPQANAVRVMDFEQTHGFWVEPGIQRYFEHVHHLLDLDITWHQVVPVVNTMYGVAHGVVTMAMAIWLFWRHRNLFPFVRNVFIVTTFLSVVTYNIFPTAPPRLATGMTYHGRPFHFIDTVFVGGGVNLGFDRYAAMPSLHVAWALIVGVTVFLTARNLGVRLLGIVHPILMCLAVIVTANHYIADCLAALAIVLIAYLVAWLGSKTKVSWITGVKAGTPDVRA